MASSAAAGGPKSVRTARASTGGDRFYDFVVYASVLLFILLAAGVGLLALQSSLH